MCIRDSMSLKYRCPSCGTSLGYEGLCWKCQMEKERQDVLAWSPEPVSYTHLIRGGRCL